MTIICAPLPSAAYLNERFSYSVVSGSLTWKDWPAWPLCIRSRQFGKEAGRRHPTKGHIQVELDGRNYLAHRIIYKMVTGEDPLEQVDHRNGIGYHNGWINLREATHGENRSNARQTTELPRGVTRNGKRFGAQIVKNRKHHWLGTFPSPEEAHQAYLAAAEKLHAGFAFHNRPVDV